MTAIELENIANTSSKENEDNKKSKKQKVNTTDTIQINPNNSGPFQIYQALTHQGGSNLDRHQP